MILAIDFDGVIHDHKNPITGRRMGPPILGAKETLDKLKQGGHTLIIHSVWGGDAKTIGDFMCYYHLPFDEITNLKPQADYYIDDKAIKFTNWDDIFQEIAHKTIRQ